MPSVPKYNEKNAGYRSIIEQGETLHSLQRLYRAVKYGNNHVPTRPDNELVAVNFPDPDITLLSPAFMSPESVPSGFDNGTEGPTDDATMDYFLRSLATRNDWMTYMGPELVSEEGRVLPTVFLSTSSQSSSAANGTSSKIRVWLQGAVHGNEPAGDQSLLALLGKMDANQTWASSLLSNMDIMVLPRYNADGVYYFQRTLATNFDPNRDHIKLARQQTQDIKQVFSDFAPHVAADMHEFSAPSVYGGSYRHGADALFSAAKNLNIHSSIRRLSEDLFAPAISSALEAGGFRWEPYVTGTSNSTPGSNITFDEAGSDPKIGRNAMGLTQCITFLCETRGIGLASQEFRRRTATGLAMVEAIIQTASDIAADVQETVSSAVNDFTNSNEDITVTDSTTETNRTFTMVDIRNGSLVQVPITFTSTTPTTANLTRSRPQAYLIPASWPDLAARFTTSGLTVDVLPYTYRGTVEVLNITSASLDSTYYEGTVPVTVTTEPIEKEVELPAGAIWVSTAQKNAALAMVALEPEGIDSYVSFNIVPVEEGDEYPVFRVMG